MKNKQISEMSNNELARFHSDMVKKLRSEQARLMNKKDEAQAALKNPVKNGGIPGKDLSDIDSKALFAGNAGDINKIIWPFVFTTSFVELDPANNLEKDIADITITQEAPFCLYSMTKNVFKWSVANSRWEYVNPRAVSVDGVEGGFAPGLKFNIVDASSDRRWYNSPISLDHIGDGFNPFVLPSPQFILPNSSLEVQFFSTDTNEKYAVNMTFMGYRLRVEDAQNILSTVTS